MDQVPFFITIQNCGSKQVCLLLVQANETGLMAGLRDYDPLVILVSGKRKSGKDYFSNTVHKR